MAATFIHNPYIRWGEQFHATVALPPGKAIRCQLHGRLSGTQSRSVPFGEETPPCPWRKLNWDSAYSLLRILQVEQRCGGCHFPLHRCYTCLPSRFVVVFRSAACHVHAKFKSRQPVAWCLLQHCDAFWKDLPAHSHYRSTSLDLAIQTVQCDHLFPHSYSVARNPIPHRCNLCVQVFRVVFRSSSS